MRVLLQVLLGCARGESQVIVAGEDALNLFPDCTGNHRVRGRGREVTQTQRWERCLGVQPLLSRAASSPGSCTL